MANFLDETGVAKLWTKVRGLFNKGIVNLSVNGTTIICTKGDGTTKTVSVELVKGQTIYCCSNTDDQIYCC